VPGGVRGGVSGGVPGGVPGGVIGGTVGGGPTGGIVRTETLAAPQGGGTLGGIVGSVPTGAKIPPPPGIRKVEPEYPALARQARISGVVYLSVTVAPDGQLKRMQVVSGHPILVPAAMESVRKWTFPPIPSEMTWTFDIAFKLPPDASQAMDSARPAVPARIKVGGNIQAAKLLRNVEPAYPAAARAEGIQGDVTLQIVIDKTGQVIQADPIDGNPVLAAAARDAVLQRAYQVTLLNGEPVEVVTQAVVSFRIQ
jgi:TonB family protein